MNVRKGLECEWGHLWETDWPLQMVWFKGLPKAVPSPISSLPAGLGETSALSRTSSVGMQPWQAHRAHAWRGSAVPILPLSLIYLWTCVSEVWWVKGTRAWCMGEAIWRCARPPHSLLPHECKLPMDPGSLGVPRRCWEPQEATLSIQTRTCLFFFFF